MDSKADHLKSKRRWTAIGTLTAFASTLLWPAATLAQDKGPPLVKPFKDSLKRAERLKRPKFGAGAKKLRDPRKSRPQPLMPPPPSAAAAGAKEEDKSRPIKENHMRPWPKWRRGRIDFDKADIRDVAKFISEITGKNIILSDKARGGKLTIFSPSAITKGEAYQAFLAALEVNNLTAVGSGKFLKIVPQRDAKEMPIGTYRDRMPPNDDRMVTVILRVNHGDAKEINNVVSQLKNKNGFNLVYAPTNSLIIADVAANVRRLLRIVNMLDVSTGTREKIWAVKLEHATATDLVEKINTLFGDKGGPAKPGAPPPPPKPRKPGKPGAPAGPSVIGEASEGEVFRVSKVMADDRTNQLIIMASEATYLRVLALIARIDVKLTHDDSKVHVYYLQNAEAESVATVLSNLAQAGGSGASRRPTSAAPARPGQKSPSGGGASASAAAGALFEGEVKVSADKATNALVIVASPKDFDRMKRVVAKLDIRRSQVFVEAVIMEISMTKSRQLGLAFNAGTAVDVSGQQVPIFGGTTFGRLSSLALDPSVLTGLALGVRGPTIEGSSGLLSGGLGGATGGVGISLPAFGVVLRALQSTNDVNVLSTPHILASDNEEAEILVGQNVPFITGGSVGGFGGGLPGIGGIGGQLGGIGGALGGLAGGLGGLAGGLGGFGGGFPMIQRQDVALTLKLTPSINAGDFVKLKVEQEVNDLAGDDPIRGPTTTKRRVKTVVSVKDQQTVVIGGLIRDTYSEDINKVPILGDVPIIGYFFRDTSRRQEKRNLLLFLTPYIIKDQSDFRRIYKQKMEERQEFLERFASGVKDYKSAIDYTKRHGMLEEVNQTVDNIEKREIDESKMTAEEKKKAEKEKLYEVIRGEEIKPLKDYKRIDLDKLAPAGAALGERAPTDAGKASIGGEVRYLDDRRQPPKKPKADAEGVKDE